MTQPFERISQHRCFGGTMGFYRHQAASTTSAMRFAVFVPPQAASARVPVLYCLAGLTCTEETFMIKAGAQRVAAELGMMLVTPDTSPRGLNLPGESDSWDFGVGAGFYVDATEAPWSKHFRMYTYVTQELRELVTAHFPADPARCGILGHSMGGHGALVLGLRNPDLYRSISAFAPIAAPRQCPWGKKAFGGYLGEDRGQWAQYDASEIAAGVKDAAQRAPLLVDQGLADQFLAEQLYPERLEQACRSSGLKLTLRRHEGYDHGYYFISTLIEEHLRHHARILKA
ncbi:MAG: S-formylglutathione hydrolase [Steroidobacteraceae bacterium]